MTGYTVSPDARDDLDDIWDYIADQSPAAADNTLDTLIERFALLCTMPRSGEARPDLAEGVRHLRVGSYLILYRLRSSGIDVLRIIHGARDIPTVFRERRR